jgi:hypothetical protein
MCGAEALIRGRYGVITNKDKKPIIYDHTLSDFTILNGIIFGRS